MQIQMIYVGSQNRYDLRLVAMVLFEAPSKVGIAQTMFLLPGLMFLLVGGSIADRYGAARVAFITHLLGILPPLFLAAAIYYGAMYGGRISSILLNIPGDEPALMTTLDGYPMAKQGRAGDHEAGL